MNPPRSDAKFRFPSSKRPLPSPRHSGAAKSAEPILGPASSISGRSSAGLSRAKTVSRLSTASSVHSISLQPRLAASARASGGPRKLTAPLAPLDPPGIITERKIAKKHFIGHADAEDSVRKLTRVRLDRLELQSVDNLGVFCPATTHLYLQHNAIASLPLPGLGLDRLVFLTLAHNKLKDTKGLETLGSLSLLDLEGNLIASGDSLHLPPQLDYLVLRENPIASAFDYRLQVIVKVEHLLELDEKKIDSLERRIARMNASIGKEPVAVVEPAEEEVEDDEPTSDPPDADVYAVGFQRLLDRSRLRQMETTTRSHLFEDLVQESITDRKEHWNRLKKRDIF
ncbi:hypothetical protein HDV03_002561 [Kappamyces sp. JEL0829]|nr:hypothetical protein HDV03_002561 [Kappamyces sp. JEL0829]